LNLTGFDSRRLRAASSLALIACLASASVAWPQQQPATPAAPRAPAPPIPQFPPGPDFPGVAGSAAELARITAVCGANRNARDGYNPAPAFAGQRNAPIVKGTQGYNVETIAKIDRPWGMAFLPNGKMLVSFRDGGMRIVTTQGQVSEPLAGVPQMVQPRLGSGMYDVILDKDFARNRTIYFTYHTRFAGDPAPMGGVASAKLAADEKSITDVKTLREGADIQPRRIVQARDGTLLILSASLVDSGPVPQDMAGQLGKVLRINADGSIPRDNPFLATAGANTAIWALGYRDIHSAVIHPTTGELWVADNTPMGGDELNVMRKGKNYGYPVISYGRQNSGALINGGKTAQDGMEQPLYTWTPSIAPSGMLIYTGNAFPGWKNNIFIGALSGEQITRLVMNGEKVVGEEKLLMDRCQRFKEIEQGPDGNIYILTDEMPGQPNEILRLVPARAVPPPRTTPASPPPPPPAAPAQRPAAAAPPPAAVDDVALGANAFGRACAACHGQGGGGGLGPAIAGRTDIANIVAVIRNGAGSMPAMASSMTPTEIDAVAKHLGRLTR